MKNLYVFVLILSFPLLLCAQTIHGIWTGTLINDSTHHTQNFELGLSEYAGKITGYTFTTFIDNDTFYYSIKKIKAERKDGKLVIEDEEMVGNNFPERAAKHVKQTTVFPLINDSTIDLANGRWSTNQTKKYYSIGGSATVKEQEDEKKSDLLAHLDEMNIKSDIASASKKKSEPTPVVKSDSPAQSNDDKKTDVALNSKKQSSNTPKENEPQKGDAVDSPGQDKKENVASNKAASNTTIETEKKDSTQKTAVANINPSTTKDRQTNKEESVMLTKPFARKDTMVQVAKKENEQLNQNLRDKENQNIVAVNTRSAQQKDVTEIKKDIKPADNNQVKSLTVAPNSTPNGAKDKNKNDQPVSQTQLGTKKEVATTISQPKDQPADKTPEKQLANFATVTPAQTRNAIVDNKPLPTMVANRKNENIQDLYFKNDSLVLSLYDNGIVDGDTVSVFLNGEPIISKQMLKVSAIKKTIHISENMDSVQLVLFAENLGSIPPNTGLLTVRDGDDVYQVRFSADLQNNASIVLRRRK